MENIEAAWSAQAFKQLLALLNSKSKKDIIAKISKVDENILVCLVELVFNILAGKLHLKPSIKKNLRPHVTRLRTLSSLREVPRVREFLVQKGGGFLPALLPIIISCAAEILHHVI